MISEKELTDLALLARLKLAAEEKAGLLKDVGAILDYVNQLKSASVVSDQAPEAPILRNVLRSDGEPHPPNGGFFERGRLTVKAIFDFDRR